MNAPPQNREAEQAVLGALLLGADIVDDIADELDGRDFYQPNHEAIFDACLAVHRRGERIDPLLVARQLGADLQRIGGAPYLHTLTTSEVTPTPAQARHYASLVLEAAIRRRLIDAGSRVVQLATSADDIREAAELARGAVDAAAAHGTDEEAGLGASQLLEETIDALQAEADAGLSTGWADLDRDVNGLRAGQLVVVGARPSVGKSVIAANMAAATCAHGVGVHFASLEMTRREVMQRMIAAQATIELDRVVGHRLDDGDWNRVARKQAEISAWPLWVDDTPQQSLLQIRARARTTKRRMGLGLLVVDYLQLMAPRDRRVPREQQVGELSEGLKNLAKELEVPIVALAQLNRGSAERQDKRPVMSDLRESGRIEADADHVWLLHRQDMVDPNSMTGEIEVHIAKNRNGPSGKTVRLSFQGHYSRAVQLAWTPTGAIA